MENGKRNSYLISKAMKNFLLASMLTMLIAQLNVFIDGIIVSHLIGPDALSAINLFTPLNLAITALGTFLGTGATVLAARYLGERNKPKFDKAICTALISVITTGVLLAIAVFIFRESLFGFICKEERIKAYFYEYTIVMLSCGGIVMLSTLFDQITTVNGKPQVVTKAVILSAVSNIILDYVLIAWFNTGIAGSAYASILALLISIGFLLIHSEQEVFKKTFSNFSLTSLKENMTQGLPMIIGNTALMLMFFFLNNIIQDTQGADGMFVWSICMGLLSIGMMLASGIGSATLAIGSLLRGQRDYSGLNILVRKSIMLLLGGVTVVTVFVLLFPQVISSLFGANTYELAQYANSSLRIFACMLPFVLYAIFSASLFQMLGYLVLPPIVILTFPLVLLPSMLAWGKYVGNNFIWYAFPQTGIVVMSLILIITKCFRRKKPNLSPITLVPRINSENIFDRSIQVSPNALSESLSELTEYLRRLGIGSSLCHKVNLCLEELMLNIVQHAGLKMQNHYFDIRINRFEGKLTVSLTDDGKPFNTVYVLEEEKGLGLKIAHGLCEDIDYKYMYGQNMTYLTWKIEK